MVSFKTGPNNVCYSAVFRCIPLYVWLNAQNLTHSRLWIVRLNSCEVWHLLVWFISPRNSVNGSNTIWYLPSQIQGVIFWKTPILTLIWNRPTQKVAFRRPAVVEVNYNKPTKSIAYYKTVMNTLLKASWNFGNKSGDFHLHQWFPRQPSIWSFQV